jgi:hypothetical protein
MRAILDPATVSDRVEVALRFDEPPEPSSLPVQPVRHLDEKGVVGMQSKQVAVVLGP